jgi:lipopolysaccharide/colanic/teichoic acid biosynthesis glycosyltransferase
VRRRERVRRVRLLLPALTAGVAAQLTLGRPSASLLFVAATLIASALIRGFPYPLSLMPLSRAVLAAAGPAIATLGISLVAALSFDVSAIPPADALIIAGAAMTVAAAAEIAGIAWAMRVPMRVAVLGSPDFAVALRRTLAANPVCGIELVGWLNVGSELLDPGPSGRAAVARLRRTTSDHRIDLIVRGRPGAGGSPAIYGGAGPFEFAAESLVDLPVRMMDGAQFYEESFGHVPLGTINSAWYLFLVHPRFRPSGARLKRAVDLVIGSLVGLVTLPLVALAAVAIKLEDRGPVLYRQPRVGAGGREFEIVKLRTMSVGSGSETAHWSVAGDARITRVGSLLRRTHIDELPQLLSVLSGEMTLVGPRPEQPRIVAELERHFPHYSRRHLVKPGVTGWAQVRCGYAGSELGAAWKLCHDLYYLKHGSVPSDLMIMLETLAIVAKDAHRPLRMPEQHFVFGSESGVEPSAVLAAAAGEPEAPEKLAPALL